MQKIIREQVILQYPKLSGISEIAWIKRNTRLA
jgi:hypothetical protein